MVAINFEGFWVSKVNTLAKKPSCFFSISIWILFAEMKAISIPEKNAENNSDRAIMVKEKSKAIADCPFVVVQTVCDISS
jgi:hypothetical protein